MGPDGNPLPSETFALAGRAGLVALDEDGIHHPRAPRSGAFVHTRYEDVTHLASSPRAIWLGARRSVYVLPRRAFALEGAPDRFLRSVLERIAARPGGDRQLARMAEIESVSRASSPTRATWGLALVCLLALPIELLIGHDVHEVGHYNALLVADGDWWRLVTANLLHGYPSVPVHLLLNLLGLVALGTLAERPLGAARTLLVMGASGLAGMLASGWAGYPDVVGVSGVVFGLLGAVTWLELRCADRLPAWWRVPRRAIFAMLVFSAVLALLVPVIAGAAHLGGLVAGALAAAVSFRPAWQAPRAWVRAAAASVVAGTALAVMVAGAGLTGPEDYSSYMAKRIAGLPGVSPLELNNRAWLIALDPDSSPEMLEAALAMAERAVIETQREEPTVLDTLAEIQFLLGNGSAAVATIEEAIEQEPAERYYREQLRRFLGERDRDDRPPAPGLPEEPRMPESPGITV